MKTRFKLIPAVYLFLRQKDQILLLRRANTGYQDGMYSVPSGHLEGGELALAAMRREAKEEVNIDIEESDLKFVHVSQRLNGSRDQERIDLFFECSKWKGKVNNNEPDKCDDLKWFNVNKLPDNIIPHVRIVLDKALLDNHYSEYSSEPQR